MSDQLVQVPSVRDLSSALLKLRERTGINLQKVWHATQLLDLPVVRRQAELEMRQHELDAVAFELLECVLRDGSYVLADRVRITIYTEYNFERTDSTYTDRKGQVLNRLDIRTDYERHSRICYDDLAGTLVPLREWPCSQRSADKNRRIAQLSQLHDDLSTNVLREALMSIAQLRGSDGAREIAERILRELPNARQTAEAIAVDFWTSTADGVQILQGIINRLVRREYRKWRDNALSVEVAPQDGEYNGKALEQMLFPNVGKLSSGGRAIDVDSTAVASGLHLLAIMMRSFEIRDSWIEVLLEDDVRDRMGITSG